MARVAELLAADDPSRLERELLLASLLGRDRGWLYAHPDDAVDAALVSRFEQDCERLGQGMPLAYLLGEWEFFSLTLAVSPATLVPRPETEELVQVALSQLPPDTPRRVLDLGTGSGAIALAIAAHRPLCEVTATDISEAALAVARGNASRLELGNVSFQAGSWWQAVPGRQFDLVVSNPPYVAEGDPSLQARGEPELALLAGPDGLEAYRQIVPAAPAHLTPDGALLVEHGYNQRASLMALCDPWFDKLSTWDDLAGIERLLLARSPRR